MVCRFCFPKPSPSGEGGPAGPNEGAGLRLYPHLRVTDKPAPHPSAVGAADSFPRGGSLFTFKRKMTLATNAGTLVDMACGRMT